MLFLDTFGMRRLSAQLPIWRHTEEEDNNAHTVWLRGDTFRLVASDVNTSGRVFGRGGAFKLVKFDSHDGFNFLF